MKSQFTLNHEPQASRVQPWFRAMLWLMPTTFAICTLIGWSWLTGKFGDLPVWTVIWWVSNPLFVVGTGWFHAQLSRRGETGRGWTFLHVGKFCLLQLLLLPLLGGVLMVIAIKCDLIVIE